MEVSSITAQYEHHIGDRGFLVRLDLFIDLLEICVKEIDIVDNGTKLCFLLQVIQQ
jgi:hypothetical protein